MSKSKKTLEAALKKTDGLPSHWFGAEEALMDELPSVLRSKRVRKNIFIEKATADALEQFCERNHVSFTDVANDILTKFVSAQKKRKTG
jgi:hypothetical protein